MREIVPALLWIVGIICLTQAVKRWREASYDAGYNDRVTDELEIHRQSTGD